MKKALITGITGQDGSYLTELLLAKGYTIHGIVRRSSSLARTRLEHIYRARHFEREKLYLEYGDMTDGSSLRTIITRVAPDEVYNLAAQSHVRVSFDTPEYTVDVADVGTLRLLEALRDYQKLTGKAVRYYQASSSEMFGSTPPPQNETTPFHPRSPYAIAKVAGFWHTVNYREAYAMHCSNGILFNHESERRGENFVTRKITLAAGRIKVGLQKDLVSGQSRCPARLGLREGLCRGDVADVAAGKAGRLRAWPPGESRSVREFLDGELRSARAELAGLREDGCVLHPSQRGGFSEGRRHKGAAETRLAA